MRCHALRWIDGEAALDEIAGGVGDGVPAFHWGKGVVRNEGSVDLFKVGIALERCVAAENEEGYRAYGPDIAVSNFR
jgi:hypothetical protein